MRGLKVAGYVFLFAGGAVAGSAASIWFTQNYQIVPVEQDRATVPPAKTAIDNLGQPLAASPAAGQPNTPPPQRGEPLFSYRFQPGEELDYKLNVDVVGEGVDMGEGSSIALTIDGDMGLDTKSVDPQGNGNLRLAFDAIHMQGDFMGSPVSLSQDQHGTQYAGQGREVINTPQGLGSIQGIPQLEFFKEPIDMTVMPDGRIAKLAGGQDIGTMLAVTPSMATLQFPTEQLESGATWESDLNMPVPGFGTPVKAHIINKLEGYQMIDDRLCAIISQEFLAQQKDGTVHSPESVFGEAMDFSLGHFNLTGWNTVYFDVEAGQLVHTDMDLRLDLELSDTLKPFGDLMGLMNDLAAGDASGLDNYLDRGPEQQSQTQPEKKNLLDMGVGIQGSLSLVR